MVRLAVEDVRAEDLDRDQLLAELALERRCEFHHLLEDLQLVGLVLRRLAPQLDLVHRRGQVTVRRQQVTVVIALLLAQARLECVDQSVLDSFVLLHLLLQALDLALVLRL